MSRPTGSADPVSNEPACGSTRRRRPIHAYVRDVIALEVGLNGVRVLQGQAVTVGPPVDAGLVEAALDWIDDPVGLYDGRPVAVADLWRCVMVAVAGRRCDSMVLVHPDDWPRRRIARVLAAANTVSDQVAPMRRSEWYPEPRQENADEPRVRRRRAPLLVCLGAVGAVGAAVTALLARALPPEVGRAALIDITTVVEGRVAVQFPRSWNVARVTGGPGSPRLQANSPADPDLAVHVTQSYTPESTLGQTAVVLRRVIAEQPVGLFVDFDDDATVGELPALTYREIRPGRVIEWMVLLVGSTRVAVGCQSPPERAGAVRPICVQVATSARENSPEGGTDPRR
jgi:type VII secretion-associated protein (TIGR03931 family)